MEGDGDDSGREIGDTVDAIYLSNWAGSMIIGPPSGETFNYIHGQFVVPTPSEPSSVRSASAWMGLDGCTYPVLIRAGLDFNANDDGSTFYSPWYEWLPSAAIYFAHSEFSLQAGNTLEISITATNITHGNIVLRNISTDLAVTRAVSAPDSNSALGVQTAEWIVEDYQLGDTQVAFTNFGSMQFTDEYAGTGKRSQLGSDTGDMVVLVGANYSVITQVVMSSLNEAAVIYLS